MDEVPVKSTLLIRYGKGSLNLAEPTTRNPLQHDPAIPNTVICAETFRLALFVMVCRRKWLRESIHDADLAHQQLPSPPPPR